MEYKKPVSVLVVIHTQALDVLLLERALHPGFWQSVTGSQEGDEALLETARREVREETGIDAPAAGFIDWRDRYAPGVTENTEHVFSLCLPAPVEVVIAPNEHLAWRWLPWREAAAACFSWTNRDAILELPLRLVGSAEPH